MPPRKINLKWIQSIGSDIGEQLTPSPYGRLVAETKTLSPDSFAAPLLAESVTTHALPLVPYTDGFVVGSRG